MSSANTLIGKVYQVFVPIHFEHYAFRFTWVAVLLHKEKDTVFWNSSNFQQKISFLHWNIYDRRICNYLKKSIIVRAIYLHLLFLSKSSALYRKLLLCNLHNFSTPTPQKSISSSTSLVVWHFIGDVLLLETCYRYCFWTFFLWIRSVKKFNHGLLYLIQFQDRLADQSCTANQKPGNFKLQLQQDHSKPWRWFLLLGTFSW